MKIIDLFCGMGGFRLAFEKWGCKCVFSSDIDKFAQETYKLNFNEQPYGDITKIKSTDIPDFDILCAGFPCQPFSIAGRRLGFEDTRGTLFFEVARILQEKKPKAFFLENVRGLANHDKGNTVKVIMQTLNDLGYTATAKVLNAKDYGVPQNRERWYCVGFRKDIVGENFEFPFSVGKIDKYDLTSVIESNEEKEYLCSDICFSHIEKYIKEKNIVVDDYTLAYDIRPSRCHFATKLISPCLTAKMGTGGNNVPVVIKQKRRLTEQECLKIMGYPETYKVYKGSHTYKQLGNSVVVPVLTEIAKEMVAILEENV